MRARFAALLLLGFLAAPVRAETATPAPGPTLDSTQLRNGLSLLVVENPRLPVFSLQLWVRAGSVHEEASEDGAAALVAELLAPGGRRYGREGVDRWVQEAGGRSYVELRREATVFALELSSDQLERAFEITADRLAKPRFDAAALEQARQRALAAAAQQGDPALSLAEQRLMATAFLAQAYRRPLRGWPGSLAQRSVEDCQRFFSRRYLPGAMTLVVVGDVRATRVRALARKHLGKLRRGSLVEPSMPGEPEPGGERRLVETVPGSLDVVAVGYRLPPLDHPDSAALRVLDELLSGAGHGPLATIPGPGGAVAEVATAELMQGRQAGLYLVRLALAPGQDAWAAEQRLVQVLEGIAAHIDDAAVAQARARQLARRRFERIRVDGAASCLGQSAVLVGSPERYRAQLGALQQVDSAALRRVAGAYLRAERRTVVHLQSEPSVAGPRPGRSGGR